MNYFTDAEEAVTAIAASTERVPKVTREEKNWISKVYRGVPLTDDSLQAPYGHISFITTHRSSASGGRILSMLSPLPDLPPMQWSNSAPVEAAEPLKATLFRPENLSCVTISKQLALRPLFHAYTGAAASRRRFGLAAPIHTPKRFYWWSFRGERSILLERLQSLSINALETLAVTALLHLFEHMEEAKSGLFLALKVDNTAAAFAVRTGSGSIRAVSVFVDIIHPRAMF